MSQSLGAAGAFGWGRANASNPWVVVISTKSFAATGAALLLFSSPSANALAGLPSRTFNTIALSLESGVKSAPYGAVTGCEAIRPGSRRRQISEPLLRDKR